MHNQPKTFKVTFFFVLGQGAPDFICKKPKHVDALNVGDDERGEKVVCGKDVTAIITNKGYFFIL